MASDAVNATAIVLFCPSAISSFNADGLQLIAGAAGNSDGANKSTIKTRLVIPKPVAIQLKTCFFTASGIFSLYDRNQFRPNYQKARPGPTPNRAHYESLLLTYRPLTSL